jgi:predicted PurR-regulated permease PerM
MTTAQEPAVADGDAVRRASRMPGPGLWAWAFVGIAAAVTIVAAVVAALNEILLPLTFAVVLAVVFKPLATTLVRRRLRPGVAAGVVVLGLLGLVALVVVAMVQGVGDQLDRIGDSVDDAASEAQASLDIDQTTVDAVTGAVASLSPGVTVGFLTTLVSGVGTLVGLAGGFILGSLVMYYVVKDGTTMRRSLVTGVRPQSQEDVDEFIGDACRSLRAYGYGRTVMSAVVAMVIGVTSLLLGLPLVPTIMLVNFVGGYIPYIGAFLGGGLAVVVALGDGGIPEAAVMLVVVLAANLLLENFVEPKVMGGALHIHPVVVLVVTAVGGLVGGIVGLILAVPFTVILADAVRRLRARGLIAEVAERAEPVVRRALQ